jgi:hypothetical protein
MRRMRRAGSAERFVAAAAAPKGSLAGDLQGVGQRGIGVVLKLRLIFALVSLLMKSKGFQREIIDLETT